MESSLVTEGYITEMDGRISDIALTNLKEAIDSKEYTGPEIMAMKMFEELRLIGGMDLAALVMRGSRIKQIREMNLAYVHPAKYASMEEAIETEAKISRTQQSVITNLYEHVLPYVQQKLGISPEQFWEEISPSNASDVVPHLRQLTTGEPSKSEGVRNYVDKLLEETGGNIPVAVETILERSKGTNKELRRELRGDGTPPVLASIYYKQDSNGKIIGMFMLAEVTEDQVTMMRRTFNAYLDVVPHLEGLDTLPIYKRMVKNDSE